MRVADEMEGHEMCGQTGRYPHVCPSKQRQRSMLSTYVESRPCAENAQGWGTRHFHLALFG
jgi:hypothetical protein